MRFYVTLLERVYTKAGVPDVPKVHIGGDLLTRVMASGSKLLMIKAPSSAERFDCLSPISAEYFHMAMKLLAVIMKRLWTSSSGASLGTLRNLQLRTQRHDVNANVKKAYNEDKEFFLNFTNANIIEAICSHFGLADINSTPTCHVAPSDRDKWYEWALQEFRALIKSSVGTFCFNKQGELSGFKKDILKIEVLMGYAVLLMIDNVRIPYSSKPVKN